MPWPQFQSWEQGQRRGCEDVAGTGAKARRQRRAYVFMSREEPGVASGYKGKWNKMTLRDTQKGRPFTAFKKFFFFGIYLQLP